MTINRQNFEAYMLDYLEGNLDPLLTADLMAFLAENPEFENYVPDLSNAISPGEINKYPGKSLLKKGFSDVSEITSENFDEFCIATCEGMLSVAEHERFTEYLKDHPEKQADFELYRKIKLQPDLSLRYPGKASLKKTAFRVGNLRYLYYAAGIAASVAVLVLLFTRNSSTTVLTGALPVKETPSVSVPTPVPSTLDAEEALQEVPRELPHRRIADQASLVAETFSKEQVAPREEPLPVLPLKPISGAYVAPATGYTNVALHEASHGRPYQEDEILVTEDGLAEVIENSFMGSLIAKVDFWKTAETAIQGFNYMTEASLSINKTMDGHGKLSSLKVNTESYSFSGNKIK